MLIRGRRPSAANWLGVMSSQVGYTADGWAADGSVVAVMVVDVDPVGKRVGSLLF